MWCIRSKKTSSDVGGDGRLYLSPTRNGAVASLRDDKRRAYRFQTKEMADTALRLMGMAGVFLGEGLAVSRCVVLK